MDTQGACTIQLSTVGGASAKLIDVCSYPSAQPNSDPSDCVIARNDFGKVELIKDIVPNSDTGLFNLTINGPEASDTTTVNNVGDGGTTGEVVVKKGTVIVSETAGTSTTLSNYSTSIICKDLNGTGATIAGGSPTGASSRQLSFTLVEDADVVCTITNTRKNANIQVVKDVINNNGGTKTYADFTFQVNGGSAQTFDETTSPDGSKTVSVPLGSTYTITEPEANQDGYATTYSNCTDIVPVDGQTQVCTITNDDIAPTITLEKTVVNDDGGGAVESDFQASLDGQDVDWDAQTSVSAGSHTASETTLTGYEDGDWGGDCNADGTITVALGQDYTCTITNDDIAPTLQLIKNLTNDNGGSALASDWFLIATNSSTDQDLINEQGTGDTTAETDTYDAAAGVIYVLSESSGPSGYTEGLWSCTGGGTLDGGNLTLSLAENVICTITNNDDAPSLTLVKEVTNDNGGKRTADEWTLTATGSSQSPTNLSGAGGDTSGSDFKADTYTLDESGPSDYTEGTWSCDNEVTVNGDNQITLANGQTTTCTIINDDIAPTLTVTKIVLNPYGNPLLASAFPLFVDSTSVTSGVPTAQFDAGSHTISETQQTGYEFTGIDGDCTLEDDIISVLLGLAGSYTCVITNTAIQPRLIVIKHVVNDNGGDKEASDFTMTVSGNSQVVKDFPGEESPGTELLLNEGSFSVDELADDGYAKSFSGDCESTIAIGETKTCTITNDDIAPVLTLKKEINSVNPAREPSGWTLTATPTEGPTISGNGEDGVVEEEALSHTTYTLSETNTSDGSFDSSDWYCTSSAGVFSNPDGNNNEIRMSEGANVTCTITNTERAKVIVTKFNDYNRDQKKDANEPTLSGWDMCLEQTEYDDSSFLYSQVTNNIIDNGFCGTGTDKLTDADGKAIFDELEPNQEYILSEDLKDGWYWSNTYCEYPYQQNGRGDLKQPNKYEFYVTPGEKLNCFVGNYRDAVLLLEKTNNKPDPTVNGDVVTYTLTAKVPEDSNPVYGVEVKDLMPENFEFVAGTASASQGSLTGTYASPGTWTLGDIFPGQQVTMTYRALITNLVSPGSYPDLAFAVGGDNPVEGQAVLSNVHITTNNPFVGTKVTIRGEVLGAVLVNTGNRLMALQFIVPIMVILGVLSLESRQKKGASL